MSFTCLEVPSVHTPLRGLQSLPTKAQCPRQHPALSPTLDRTRLPCCTGSHHSISPCLSPEEVSYGHSIPHLREFLTPSWEPAEALSAQQKKKLAGELIRLCPCPLSQSKASSSQGTHPSAPPLTHVPHLRSSLQACAFAAPVLVVTVHHPSC